MTPPDRVLPLDVLSSLDDHLARGGGRGIEAAQALSPTEIVETVATAGLRGRGGAGFPTGRKWQTVVANRSPLESATVVVNGAEGEPGCFKDRSILHRNPYAVLEGALIAARAVGAAQIIVALKTSFTDAVRRVDTAIDEVTAAGWCDGVEIAIFEGPGEYLYGEETALLESIDGRYPFPRVAPPFRRGVEELVDASSDVRSASSSAAHVEMAGAGDETVAPPTLVDNVETMANVPGILAYGPEWFRELGTAESPGTIVVTVSGSVQHPGVGEVELGTSLADAIASIGGGPLPGRRITAAMSGVSNALVPAAQLDTPLTYEAMTAIGAGLGAAGFLVFDDAVAPVAIAAGAARFLAVESCGQCRHCKQGGLELSELLDRIAGSEATEIDRERVDAVLETIADGARCNLPYQQQAVVGSVLARFPDDVAAHVHGQAEPVERTPIGPIATLDGAGAHLDAHELTKQPDWTFDAEDSGQWPSDRLDEHRAPETL